MHDEQLLMSERPSNSIVIVVPIVALILVGCGAGTAAAKVALRTRPPASPGQEILCLADQIIPFTLVGDPKADPPVWGVTRSDGHRFEIIWPAGFRAHFDPGLDIIDPSGAVVARAGTITDASGAGGGDVTLYICGIDGKVYAH